MKKIKILISVFVLLLGFALSNIVAQPTEQFANAGENEDKPRFLRNMELSPPKAPDYCLLIENSNNPSEKPFLSQKDYPTTVEEKIAAGGIWYDVKVNVNTAKFYITYDPGIEDIKEEYNLNDAIISPDGQKKSILINLQSNGLFVAEAHMDYGGKELIIAKSDELELRMIDYEAPKIYYKRVTVMGGKIELQLTIKDSYYSGGNTSAGSGIKIITFFSVISEEENETLHIEKPKIHGSIQATLEISFKVEISQQGVYGARIEDNMGNTRDVLVWEIDEGLGMDVELLNAATKYLASADKYNPKLISSLRGASDEFRYCYNNKYSTKEEKDLARSALSNCLYNMGSAKREVKVNIKNQDLLKTGKIYHNIQIDKHFPDAKIGDDIIINITISLYSKSSTIDKKISKLVGFTVDELLKFDYEITLNGVAHLPKLPISLQIPMYAEYKDYQVFSLANENYTDIGYKQGNGFITFELNSPSAIVFVPINKGINWTVFFIVLSVLVAGVVTVTIILIVKKKKAKAKLLATTMAEIDSQNATNMEQDSVKPIKELPKNKSKKKKRGKQ